MSPDSPFDISTPEGDKQAFDYFNNKGFVWVISNNHVIYMSKEWLMNLLGSEGKDDDTIK